jgi:hypothetical protein
MDISQLVKSCKVVSTKAEPTVFARSPFATSKALSTSCQTGMAGAKSRQDSAEREFLRKHLFNNSFCEFKCDLIAQLQAKASGNVCDPIYKRKLRQTLVSLLTEVLNSKLSEINDRIAAQQAVKDLEEDPFEMEDAQVRFKMQTHNYINKLLN